MEYRYQNTLARTLLLPWFSQVTSGRRRQIKDNAVDEHDEVKDNQIDAKSQTERRSDRNTSRLRDESTEIQADRETIQQKYKQTDGIIQQKYKQTERMIQQKYKQTENRHTSI